MKHNFSAGPSILPQDVFRQAAQAVIDFDNSGLSILEISHRSKGFTQVMEDAQRLTRELLGLDDDWHVLFLTGGASSHFFMTAMNLLGPNDKAGYLDTGSWSKKAIKEAQKLGDIEVLASSEHTNYNYIPKDYTIPEGLRYVHLTSNNTIFGTQYHEWPECDCPLVADMSSDVLSAPIDLDRFGLIYAGAQKNIGPAGVTLVLVRESFLSDGEANIPTMLNYRTHIAKGSVFNTPPVFPIYVSMLNMRWLVEQGGLEEIARRNKAKAELMYSAIDDNPMFEGIVAREDRSTMNATFSLTDPELETAFLEMCEASDISAIKGHRSVGGFRASMYNAMDIRSVEVLVDTMEKFAKKYGKAYSAV